MREYMPSESVSASDEVSAYAWMHLLYMLHP